MNVFVAFIVSMLMCCCSRARIPDVKFSDEQDFKVEIYREGMKIKELTVRRNSAQMGEIFNILEDHSRKWKSSLVSYAPRIRVKGAKFNINFHVQYAILNYEDSSNTWRQVVSDLTSQEFDKIKAAFIDKSENL